MRTLALLDTVVLVMDAPDHDLRAGDLGAVATLYAPDHAEVEFVSPTGETRALLTCPSPRCGGRTLPTC